MVSAQLYERCRRLAVRTPASTFTTPHAKATVPRSHDARNVFVDSNHMPNAARTNPVVAKMMARRNVVPGTRLAASGPYSGRSHGSARVPDLKLAVVAGSKSADLGFRADL